MLSYEIDEAETLLEGKLATAKLSLSNCEEDLEFLREQITVRVTCVVSTRYLANFVVDHGGCHRTSLQLGGCPEAEGEG